MPENTLSAFDHAIKHGADWIEFDVQRTSDNVLIVFHDETVDRTTNGSGRVVDLTFEQIRALDAGNGEKIPTFQEVITRAKASNVGILPEAKSPHLYPGIADQMMDELIENDYLENTVVQSFDFQTIEEFRKINEEVRLCPLYGLWNLHMSRPIPADAKVLCPMAEMIIINPWMIKQAHAEGRIVFVWFGIIENPTTAGLLLNLGADGVMLDDFLLMDE